MRSASSSSPATARCSSRASWTACSPACPQHYVAIVPDRHGTGTNALVLAPPGAIRPAFGEGSCVRHVAAAREAGVPYAVEETPSLALDLDTPADIVAFTRALAAAPGRGRRTAKLLGI